MNAFNKFAIDRKSLLVGDIKSLLKWALCPMQFVLFKFVHVFSLNYLKYFFVSLQDHVCKTVCIFAFQCMSSPDIIGYFWGAYSGGFT